MGGLRGLQSAAEIPHPRCGGSTRRLQRHGRPLSSDRQPSQTEMPAGTPFVLTLREEGSNLARATRADLEAIPAFRDHFVIHAETDVLHSERVHEFTWTLRPRSEAVTEMPAISLSWFNPETDKFERAHSEPIPLRVTPAPVRSDPLPPVVAKTPPVADEPPASPQPESQLVHAHSLRGRSLESVSPCSWSRRLSW